MQTCQRFRRRSSYPTARTRVARCRFPTTMSRACRVPRRSNHRFPQRECPSRRAAASPHPPAPICQPDGLHQIAQHPAPPRVQVATQSPADCCGAIGNSEQVLWFPIAERGATVDTRARKMQRFVRFAICGARSAKRFVATNEKADRVCGLGPPSSPHSVAPIALAARGSAMATASLESDPRGVIPKDLAPPGSAATVGGSTVACRGRIRVPDVRSE